MIYNFHDTQLTKSSAMAIYGSFTETTHNTASIVRFICSFHTGVFFYFDWHLCELNLATETEQQQIYCIWQFRGSSPPCEQGKAFILTRKQTINWQKWKHDTNGTYGWVQRSLPASIATDGCRSYVNQCNLNFFFYFFDGLKRTTKEQNPEMSPLTWKRCCILHIVLLHKSQRSNQNDLIMI